MKIIASSTLSRCCLSLLSLGMGLLLPCLPTLANNPFLTGSDTTQGISASGSSTADKAVLIVLDCSGSMIEAAENGQSRMFAAKQVLEKVLSELDNDVVIGLRVYGTEATTMDPVYNCQDTKLLVPPGTRNRATIVNKLREVSPNGATPIGLAMKKAIRDLDRVDANQKSVVLISDGIDTCAYDPCLIANSFRRRGIDVSFNVVGFGLGGDLAAINQLECVAKATQGRFYTAETSAQLADSVKDGVNNFQKSTSATVKEIKD